MNAKEKRAAYKKWKERQPVYDTPVECLMCNGRGWVTGTCDCCGADVDEECNFCSGGKTKTPMLSYNAWCLLLVEEEERLLKWERAQERKGYEENTKDYHPTNS